MKKVTEENLKAEPSKNKMGFFQRVYHAVKDFEKYQDFAIEGLHTAFKYILKLLLVFVTLLTIVTGYKAYLFFQEGSEYFKNSFPELQFENGILRVDQEEPIILERRGKTIWNYNRRYR